MMENIKYIKFHNKRIIPDILCMHIDKHKKITKISEEKIETGPQTLLKLIQVEQKIYDSLVPTTFLMGMLDFEKVNV